ncbi:NCS2 family permease [Dysosmobacter sp. HCP28S3_G4]|uniref:NCS2 family permease n=1 Tax=Dysosmobacter sp. HCP28S3_G4 TaxID=3438938 RepID=UPI003F89D964
MEKIFRLKDHNTDVRTEIIAGLTTFMTMAYVLAVQPSAIVGFGDAAYIVDCNGVVISKSAILIMCALISGLITLLMAFYANMPFALSTGMGTNFLLGALIQSGDMSFGSAMVITLVSGIIFVLLTVLGLRDLIVRMIPKNIKVAISASIGFFIAYLGFKNTGIGNFTDGIAMGDFTDPAVLLAIAGLLVISILTAYQVKGAILIGIVVITIAGIPLGITTLPEHFFAVPDAADLGNVFLNFDFSGLLAANAAVWIFVAFFGDFFSTLGTVLGVAGKAKMLDQDGNLPDIQKPFLVDAVGTCVGAACGCTTITTYVESSSGVEAGGRTGLTALTTGVMFLLTIFAAPLFIIIPDAATGPALIFVGFLMISGFAEIDFSNFTEAFGPFIMIMFGAYTANIAAGIGSGILAHVAIKVATGKHKEIHPGLYVLCIPLLLYFIFS